MQHSWRHPWLRTLVALFVFLVMLSSELASSFLASAASLEVTTYIVHVAKSQRPSHEDAEWFRSTLASAKGLELEEFDTGPTYSYGTVFHGFAAKLMEAEAEAMENMDGVLLVVPDDAVAHLHTTHTPHFMGLNLLMGYGLLQIMGWTSSHC